MGSEEYKAFRQALAAYEKELLEPVDTYYNGGQHRWYEQRRTELLEAVEEYAKAKQ